MPYFTSKSKFTCGTRNHLYAENDIKAYIISRPVLSKNVTYFEGEGKIIREINGN